MLSLDSQNNYLVMEVKFFAGDLLSFNSTIMEDGSQRQPSDGCGVLDEVRCLQE